MAAICSILGEGSGKVGVERGSPLAPCSHQALQLGTVTRWCICPLKNDDVYVEYTWIRNLLYINYMKLSMMICGVECHTAWVCIGVLGCTQCLPETTICLLACETPVHLIKTDRVPCCETPVRSGEWCYFYTGDTGVRRVNYLLNRMSSTTRDYLTESTS